MSDSLEVSPEVLASLSWEQGSLFPAEVSLSVVAWAHHRTQADPTAKKAVAHAKRKAAKRKATVETPMVFERSPKQGERLAVLTQTCDILKKSEDHPLVDVARVFSTKHGTTIAEASNFGSARFYRLTPPHEEPAMIVDIRWRAQVDKGLLVEHEPDNSLIAHWSKQERETFARWLGRRYSRPVLSDEDVRTISDPLRERWRRFIEEEPEVARECSINYAEFRFRRDPDGTLRVLILSPLETPDEGLGLELGEIIAEALEAFHPGVKTDPGRYLDFSMSEYLASEQIDLEWASHEEGSPSGAVPSE